MSLTKILVCDDDKNICELLRLYLEKDNFAVSIANDGEEVLNKFNIKEYNKYREWPL